MNTVVEVTIKKRGEGANGPWTMYGITLDDGRKASGFEEIRVGDRVAVQPNKKNPKYLDYKLSEGTDTPANAPQSPQTSFDNGLDSRQRAIIRQHSQSMALELLKIKQAAGWLEDQDLTPAEIKKRVDWFDADVLG